jgi:hypothetical protein
MSHLTLLDGGRDDSWRDRAACIDTDQRMFFPAQGDANTRARQMCAGCPVRVPCLDYAVDNHEEFGIWGGTTPRERQAIRRRRRPEPSTGWSPIEWTGTPASQLGDGAA